MLKLKNTIIVVDCDGIICDFYYAFTTVLKQLFDVPERPMPTREAKEWGVANLGLTKKDEHAAWDVITQTDWWWVHLNEIEPGIVKRFVALTEEKDKLRTLYFCSTRCDTAGASSQVQTNFWLQRNGAQFPNVVISKDKGNFCKSVKADWFIDDKADNVLQTLEKSPSTKSYFMAWQYGEQHVEKVKAAGGHIIRDVDDFLQAVING